MNILAINNLNIKTPLFKNDKKQNAPTFFGLKLANPIDRDTVSFQSKTQKIKQGAENTFERTKKTSGDLKNGITNVRAIKFRLMHVNAHERLLNLLTLRLGKYLSTDDKKGLITLKDRLKSNFSLIQKTASLNIGHLPDEEILGYHVFDVSGFSPILEDPKAYGVLIKVLCDMVKHGEINPVKAKYQKLPEEYKKGKLIKSNDSLNPALSSKLRDTIYDIKGYKSELWGSTNSASGYSGLHIIVKNPDNTFSEIQIKVRSVADIKWVEDEYYKIMNGKELDPTQTPLEAVLRGLRPKDVDNLTDAEKVLHKAVTKYSQEAYSLALEHPFEKDAPILAVKDAKNLTNKEKEMIAQFDFNRIKKFKININAIKDLKTVEDNYYKIMSGKNLSPDYAPIEAVLTPLRPKDPDNLTDAEKVLQKAINKYTQEAYDYELEKSGETEAPFLSVMDAKSLTNKEKEMIAPYDFNRIKLFVDACEKAKSM